jgi:hypothetical protein
LGECIIGPEPGPTPVQIAENGCFGEVCDICNIDTTVGWP